jgi:hypothetical protein
MFQDFDLAEQFNRFGLEHGFFFISFRTFFTSMYYATGKGFIIDDTVNAFKLLKQTNRSTSTSGQPR